MTQMAFGDMLISQEKGCAFQSGKSLTGFVEKRPDFAHFSGDIVKRGVARDIQRACKNWFQFASYLKKKRKKEMVGKTSKGAEISRTRSQPGNNLGRQHFRRREEFVDTESKARMNLSQLKGRKGLSPKLLRAPRRVLQR